MYGGLKKKKDKEEGGGVPLHSEFIVREKVVQVSLLDYLPPSFTL